MSDLLTPSTRQPLSPRVKLRIRALFGLVTIALIGGVLIIVSTVRAEQTQRAEAVRTAQVIGILRDIATDAVNAETGQRGFFITLDPRYLTPYNTAEASYRQLTARLAALSNDSPNLRKRLLASEIAELSEAKFGEMRESIVLIRNAQLLEARRRVLSDEGQSYMERLRTAITEYEVIESRDLDQANAKVAQTESAIFPLLAALLALIVITLVMGLLLAFRAADAEAEAANAAELAKARDRADLLARELGHRVKNLFAVVLAIIQMSGRDAPEAAPVLERITARIRALLNAHQVTQGEGGKEQALLSELVETVMAPYRVADTQCTIEGPPATLSATQIVPVGLILHEMVTNAVKYGAWSQPGGTIAITWTLSAATPPRLAIEWRETCATPLTAAEDGKQGFGTMLLKSSSRQLEAEYSRELHPDGMGLHLEFALEE